MKKKPVPPPSTAPEQPARPAGVLAAIRSAASTEAAVALLQPNGKNRPSADLAYRVNETTEAPLPQKRGLSVLVYVAAARLNAPFKVKDIEAALPGKKSVAYWCRRLAKDGLFVEAAS
jgi:hypothetical protein